MSDLRKIVENHMTEDEAIALAAIPYLESVIDRIMESEKENGISGISSVSEIDMRFLLKMTKSYAILDSIRRFQQSVKGVK